MNPSALTAPPPNALKLGRPDNRRYTYNGDKRGLVAERNLLGPDAHGVIWAPLREYYDAEADKTLVIFEPIHPDVLAAMRR